MNIDMPDLPTRLTADEYHRLIAAGAFGELRVELLDWTAAAMSPVSPARASALTRLSRLFGALFGENVAAIRQQCPVALDDGWEPRPDLVVANPGEWDDAHPRAQDIHLIIEVSDSTIRDDLVRKIPSYARNGVTEVWIVELTADVVRVHRDPEPTGRYLTELDVSPGEDISVVAFGEMAIPSARLFHASRANRQDTGSFRQRPV